MTSRRFLLAGGAMLAAQRRAAAANPPKPRPPAKAEIGLLLPLTGPDALIGDEALRGVQLAVAAADAAGGIAGQPLRLVVADAVDEARAEPVAKSLIAGHGLGLLLGTGTSSLAYPGSDAAELAQIPYIELTATADAITRRNFKFLRRICLSTGMLAQTATLAMSQRFPGRKFGLLFNTGSTAGAVAAAAQAQWQSAGLRPLISIGYPPDMANLHGPVSRLKRADAEIILHAAGVDDVLVFFGAMQEVGWRPRALIGCGPGYGLRETAFALGTALDGTLVSAAPCYPAPAEAIAQAYQARFAMPPRSAASLTAYVGARLVFDSLASLAGDASQLLSTLETASLPVGSLANGWGLAFDKSGQNTRAFATLQQWQSGRLVAL